MKKYWLNFGKIKFIRTQERIRIVGRDQFRYINGDYKTTIYAELGTGKVKRLIYSGSIIKWEPPHSGETITSEEKKRIIDCLCRNFKKRNITYRISGE